MHQIRDYQEFLDALKNARDLSLCDNLRELEAVEFELRRAIFYARMRVLDKRQALQERGESCSN